MSPFFLSTYTTKGRRARFLACLSLSFLLFAPPRPAGATEPDKKKHFWYSGAIATATYAGLRQHGHGRAFSYTAGVFVTLGIGLVKEAADGFSRVHKGQDFKFDRKDMAYNAMGAIVVPLVVVAF